MAYPNNHRKPLRYPHYFTFNKNVFTMRKGRMYTGIRLILSYSDKYFVHLRGSRLVLHKITHTANRRHNVY